MNFINSINTLNAISGNGIEIKPVIHFRMEIIRRSKGAHSSAVRYSAYCARTRLHNDYDGRTYNWSRRKDVIFSKVMLPENAPSRYNDRNVLWNEVEKVEKCKNSQLARTLVIALPSEFSADTQERIVCKYVQETFVNQGMCADVNIHDNGTGNPHAHIILTMRSIDKNGKWLAKQKKVYELDKNGKKIYDRAKRQYKCKSRKTNDWDNHKNVEQWRKKWAKLCNAEFARLGLSKRVTHESYKRQGVDIIPTKHLGSIATAMERKGTRTRVGEENRDIHFQNLKLISDIVSKTIQMLMKKMQELIQQFRQKIVREKPEKTLTDCNEVLLALYNMRYNKPEFPQYIRGYREYQRKYTRTTSREFVPSL